MLFKTPIWYLDNVCLFMERNLIKLCWGWLAADEDAADSQQSAPLLDAWQALTLRDWNTLSLREFDWLDLSAVPPPVQSCSVSQSARHGSLGFPNSCCFRASVLLRIEASRITGLRALLCLCISYNFLSQGRAQSLAVETVSSYLISTSSLNIPAPFIVAMATIK